MSFAPQQRALFQHLNCQKWSGAGVFCTFWLRNVLRATTAYTFFDISTAKSGPELVCFVHFKLRNVLRATTECTFSTSQLPKVVRSWCVLYILTSKCASRFDISTSKNGPKLVCFVHFKLRNVLRATTACTFLSLMTHPASWLRTRRFSEPTFRPSWATNHWKNTVFRDFPTFSRICIFFFLTLSLLLFSLLIFLFSLPLPCSAFHLSILSEVWLLNFLRLTLIRHLVVMPGKGWIICLSIHLLFYSWKYQSEQTITNSIVVQVFFFGWLLI